MEYRYKIVGYGKRPIERVEFVSETASFITFIEDWCGRPAKRREKKAGKIFPTFEEARADWQRQLQIKVDYARINLDRANSALGNAKGLKNPYEGEE